MSNARYGWHAKLIRVDLRAGDAAHESIPDEILQNYIGGRGLGVKLLSDELSPDVDPLSSKNKVVVATGPMTGTKAPASGRFAAVFKSPLTGTIFDCNAGGSFAPYLKACGIDAAIFEGAASTPCYVELRENGATIHDATSLWKRNTEETTELLLKAHGKDSRVLCIGPAGENGVLFANAMTDKHHALGRGGLGAVLGSKKVKAIVVAPGPREERLETGVASPETLAIVIKEINKRINASPVTGKGLRLFGTAQLVNLMNAMGIFPINNFQRGTDPRADSLSGESIREQIFTKKSACFMCSIACGRMTDTGNRSGKGPEYESDWALGADCGIFDLIAVTEANYDCNLLGMDTISCGATIACAMELNEKGVLPAGFEDFTFGNVSALKHVPSIASKEGVAGAALSEGSRRLAEKFGMSELAMQVKGLELPAYDPRGAFGMALAYATSNRGACHLRAYTVGAELLGLPKLFDRFSFSDKPDLVVKLQNSNAFYDSLVTCKFTGMGVPEDYYTRALSAITGQELSVAGAETIGERIYNTERVFNLAAGLGKKDDALPPRFLEPLPGGASAGKVPPLDIMLDMYYEIRGWSGEGVPGAKKLQELGVKLS